MKEKNIKRIIKVISYLFILLVVIAIAVMFRKNLFQSPEQIVEIVKKYGVYGPLIFLIIQLLQVILPIIPGGISNLAGVLLFGSVKGFILNYIGVVLGSIICFILSKKFGIKIINILFKEKTIKKYMKYLNNDKFSLIFFITILLPFFPDDLLCYISGLSKMTIKKFIIIVMLGKPISLLLYSIFIKMII